MATVIWILVVGLIFGMVMILALYEYRQAKKSKKTFKTKQEPTLVGSGGAPTQAALADAELAPQESSNYDPRFLVLQIRALPGNPYVGYELWQTLLAAGLSFGANNLMHYTTEKDGAGATLFSLAAATTEGTFALDELGTFRCWGLVVFMSLEARPNLLKNFDLMLEVARQIVEELGGVIYDDLQQPLNVEVLEKLRQRLHEVKAAKFGASAASEHWSE